MDAFGITIILGLAVVLTICIFGFIHSLKKKREVDRQQAEQWEMEKRAFEAKLENLGNEGNQAVRSDTMCKSCGGVLSQEGSAFVCQECGETFKESELVYDVVLISYTEPSLLTTNTIQALTGLGLPEVQNLMQSMPSVILHNISIEQAKAAKTQLTQTGATVEIK